MTDPVTDPAQPRSWREYRDVYRTGLLEDVLPFWLEHAIDREHGGYLTALDRDGRCLDTDKSLWHQGRFAWLLGELYNQVEPRREWLDLARHGLDFLRQHGHDPEDGRLWFQVTREGRPLRKRRYAFTESFAAIAWGELALATGESEAADRARQAFDRFFAHGLDPQGVQPKFTDTRPTRSLGFPMIALHVAQELRESIGLETADERIDQTIEMIREFHLDPGREAVLETVGERGEVLDHFDGRTLNPGHALEAAWFILREARLRDDTSLRRTGLDMLDWTWKRGWDPVHGGILYFVDLDGGPVQEYWHDMKFWWPQNEAILATLLAYRLTGEERYREWHARAHGWAYRHFPDPEHGEWYGYLHRDGSPSVKLKGNLWKGPYHLPRMQLVGWQLTEELIELGEGSDPGTGTGRETD